MARRGQTKQFRKFGTNNPYICTYYAFGKADANAYARRTRGNGWNARVIKRKFKADRIGKSHTRYYVYTSPQSYRRRRR